MRAISLLVAALLVVSGLSIFAMVPTTVQATSTNVSGLLNYSAGSTTAFGGGDYRFIEFGKDAAFGVVWGNATHANYIYVVAIKARYLGVGQIYWANGTPITTNHPIKIYTIYAAQLQNLTEYRDNTNDGVANYTRMYNATTGAWTNYAFTTDVGYKFVNLSTNWAASPVTVGSGTGYRTWSFSLNATNLAYYNITTKRRLPGIAPIVNYTFHLNASLVQDTNVSITQFNITVSRLLGRDVITNVVRMNDLILASADTVHYTLKWDQFIQGWTYDNRNNNAALRRLLLEVGSLVLNYVPPGVVAGWHLIHYLGDDGNATYTTASGTETANNNTGTFSQPHVFTSPNLQFGGRYTQIARFLWASKDTVDGANSTVLGQIEGGWGFFYVDATGAYYGFVLLVGLNYLGGTTIVHDPTVSTDVLTNPTFQASTTPPSNPAAYGALVVGIVLVIVLVLVAYVMIARGRKKQEPPQPPQAPPPAQPPQS